MRSTRVTIIGCLRLAVVLNLGVGACLSSEDGGGGGSGRSSDRPRRHDGLGGHDR